MQNIIDFIFQEKIIGPVLIIIGSIVIFRILKTIIKKIFTRGKNKFELKKRTTIIQLVTNVMRIFIYAIAIMMILEIYGVDTKGIVASLGIAGVVLGLALQDTAQDLMSGIKIILDNYYVVGDTITINNFMGEVIEVTLQSTKVKSYDGEVLIFSNRNVDSVINLSQAKAGVKVDIPTAYEEKTEKVEKALNEVVETMKSHKDVYPESCYLGIDSLEDSAINYSILIYCKSSEQWNIKRETLKVVKEVYEKEKIKIPYNQIEVHHGS